MWLKGTIALEALQSVAIIIVALLIFLSVFLELSDALAFNVRRERVRLLGFEIANSIDAFYRNLCGELKCIYRFSVPRPEGCHLRFIQNGVVVFSPEGTFVFPTLTTNSDIRITVEERDREIHIILEG